MKKKSTDAKIEVRGTEIAVIQHQRITFLSQTSQSRKTPTTPTISFVTGSAIAIHWNSLASGNSFTTPSLIPWNSTGLRNRLV